MSDDPCSSDEEDEDETSSDESDSSDSSEYTDSESDSSESDSEEEKINVEQKGQINQDTSYDSYTQHNELLNAIMGNEPNYHPTDSD